MFYNSFISNNQPIMYVGSLGSKISRHVFLSCLFPIIFSSNHTIHAYGAIQILRKHTGVGGLFLMLTFAYEKGFVSELEN